MRMLWRVPSPPTANGLNSVAQPYGKGVTLASSVVRVASRWPPARRCDCGLSDEGGAASPLGSNPVPVAPWPPHCTARPSSARQPFIPCLPPPCFGPPAVASRGKCAGVASPRPCCGAITFPASRGVLAGAFTGNDPQPFLFTCEKRIGRKAPARGVGCCGIRAAYPAWLTAWCTWGPPRSLPNQYPGGAARRTTLNPPPYLHLLE